MKLRWDPLGPTSAGGATDGGAPIDRYEYRYAVTGEDFPSAWVRVGYALEATVPGLDNGVQYTFQVRAVNRLGEGAHAEAVSSPRAGLPDAPRAVTARAGDGSVTLGWSTPGRVGASAVVSYEYRWNAGRGFGAPASVEPTGAAQTVLVAGLANGVRHTFEVRAVNEVGAGPWARAEAIPAGRAAGPSALTATAADGEVALNVGARRQTTAARACCATNTAGVPARRGSALGTPPARKSP